jgi:cell division transport system permease protein
MSASHNNEFSTAQVSQDHLDQPEGSKLSVSTLSSFLSWKDHHVHSALDALMRLLVVPLSSLMTWAVIGIALALPSILFVILSNVEYVSQHWGPGTQMSVYMKSSVSDDSLRVFEKEIKAFEGVANVTAVSKEDAITFFKKNSGLGEALHNLESNPFPSSLEVQYVRHHDPAVLSSLIKRLKAIDGVDTVQLDLDWVQRLYMFILLGKRITLLLVALLSLGVLLIVGNTIRLSIETRRDEIVVSKLVGATDSFIRRPFLYSGFFYGLGGSLLAWMMLLLSFYFLSGPVNSLIEAYDSDINMLTLNSHDFLGIIGCGMLLGWLGSWLAVSYHLREVDF